MPPATLLLRDLSSYAALGAISILPAVEWADSVKPVGLFYFFSLAVVTVFAGSLRQDLGEQAPISGANAAAAPFVAGASLFGLYCLLKYTQLDPATVYQFAACTFALVSSAEVLAPAIGLAATGRLWNTNPGDEPLSEADEESILEAGRLPSVAIPLLILGVYALGPVSTGGELQLATFSALNNLLACSIALSALGVLALESFVAGAALLLGLFLCALLSSIPPCHLSSAPKAPRLASRFLRLCSSLTSHSCRLASRR